MKPLPTAALLAASLLAFAPAPSAAQDAAKAAGPPAWVYPQDVKCAGRRLTLHEPQVVGFEAPTRRVALRFPTLLTDPLGRATYGSTELTGSLHVDLSSRLMRLDALDAGKATFPGAPEPDVAAVQAAFGDSLPNHLTLRLELLTARPGAFRQEAPPQFEKTPPAIVVRERPAVLVQIDGEPVLQDVEQMPLQYVVNTASDIFHDPKSGLWFLLLDGTWMQAKAIAGPWKKALGDMPTAMSQIPANHPRGHVRKFTPGTPEFAKRGPVAAAKDLPEVIVTDKPSELLLLAGDPLLTFVPGVRALQSVMNTESDLFLHLPTNLYYLLVSGRWFSAAELEGPWTLVEKLPDEFTRIPRDYVRGHVVWCVPGTPEASEACALASLEERATVNKYSTIRVLCEGKEPATAPLEGEVKIVTNTDDDCLVVDKTYYVCQRGTWWQSSTGKDGSWKPCVDLPAAIAKLSESTGLHHLRGCRPVGVESETATFALTGGYYGAFPARDAPVYGTGVARRGVLRTGNWYPAARTYGENRWYDPATGAFQPRSARPRADGTVTADEWSPYTASYGRVQLYGCRYDQGGRRMFPYAEETGFTGAVTRPDVWPLWLEDLKKREGLDVAQFPFGDRSTERAPDERRLAVDETAKIWRLGTKGPEFLEKGAWTAGKPPADVQAWLDAQIRVDARPEQWKKWREQRAAAIPINPVVTPLKTK
jgi:hypothetical protein